MSLALLDNPIASSSTPRRTAWRQFRWSRPGRRHAVWTLIVFAFTALTLTLGMILVLDHGPTKYRDPEFGKRFARLRERIEQYPDHPLIVVLGSSRVSMGVRPGVTVNGLSPGEPIMVNMSLAGSGPIMERLVLQRILAAGIKPDLILIEYWPPFMNEEGAFSEQFRLDLARLQPDDDYIVRDYFADPDRVLNKLDERRWNPWKSHHNMFMNQSSPGWLPRALRSDAMFEPIDKWGWLPGHEKVTPKQLQGAMAATRSYYVPLFQQYVISPVADRAYHDLIADCRANDIPVSLLYLPESAEFVNLMPAEKQALARDYLQQLRSELDLPLIDARGWVSDEQLPDGFHLMRPGAATLTEKLYQEVVERYPELASSGAGQ